MNVESFISLDVLLKKEKRTLLLLFLISFILRFYLGLWQNYPGTSDFPAYLIISRNLFHGKGFTEGYIGAFLYDFSQVQHPSNQMWAPLPSIIQCLFFLFSGDDSFRMAQLPSILIGSLLPSLLFLFLRRWNFQKEIALLSSVFIVFSPFFLSRSIQVDSRIYAAFLGMVALAFIYETAQKPSLGKSFWLGFFCGLAYLTRTDHMMLWLVLLISLWFFKTSWKDFLKIVVMSGIGFLVVVFPWWLRNLSVFGAFIHPGNQKLFFCKMLDNRNFYFYHYPFNWDAILADGWGTLLYHRFIVKPWRHLVTMANILGWLSSLYFFCGIYCLRKNSRWKPLMPAVIAWFILTAGYSVLTTCSLNVNSLGMQLVFFFVIVAEGMHGIISKVIPVQQKIRYIVAVFLLFLASLMPLAQEMGRLVLGRGQQWQNNLGKVVTGIGNWLGENVPQHTVIMTNRPWELHYSTGYLSVQVPYDDGIAPSLPREGQGMIKNSPTRMDTVLEVAHRYKAQYLILFDPSWKKWTILDPRLTKVTEWIADFGKYSYQVQIFKIP